MSLQHKKITLREINHLAAPAILAGIAEPVISIVDTAMIGKLGVEPLAAVGLGTSIYLLLIWVLTQTKTAISSIVSRHFGANSLEKVKSLIPQAFVFNLLLGFVIFIFVYRYSMDILRLYHADNNMLPPSSAYLRIRSIGIPIVLATYGLFGVFRGLQNTKWAMQISLLGGGVNLILDYLLIFGIGPIKPMGIEGAAYASLSAQVVMLIFAIIFFLRNTSFDFHLLSKINPEFTNLLVLSLGFFARTILLNIVFFKATLYATSYGVVAVAVHTICINIWLFSSYFIDGYANAGNAISGRLYGQQQYATMYDLAIRLLKISIGIGVVLGLVYLALYNYIPRFFSESNQVNTLFTSVFWIIIISQPLNAIAFSLDGVFKGMGKSGFLLISLAMATFLGFFPAYHIFNSMGFELPSIWWGFLFFMLLRGGILLWKFRSDYGPNGSKHIHVK